MDNYKTIANKIGEGYYTEKRSKFLAFAHHVESAAEAMDVVKGYRKKYYDARHCCYAYMIGPEDRNSALTMMGNRHQQPENLYLDRLTATN